MITSSLLSYYAYSFKGFSATSILEIKKIGALTTLMYPLIVPSFRADWQGFVCIETLSLRYVVSEISIKVSVCFF